MNPLQPILDSLKNDLQNVVKEWKTSLAGLITGLSFAAPQIVNAINGKPVDWTHVVAGIGVVVLGALATDPKLITSPLFKQIVFGWIEDWLKSQAGLTALKMAAPRLAAIQLNPEAEKISNELLVGPNGNFKYAPVRPGTVVINSSNEVWVDDGAGKFVAVGRLSSGTINYETGVYSLIFIGNPIAPVTASYAWKSTSK